MEFSPNHPIVKLCLQGMLLEEKDQPEKAGALFRQAWDEATNDFEKFLAAYYLARHPDNAAGKTEWLETALQLALRLNDEAVKAAIPLLYADLAAALEASGDPEGANKNRELAARHNDSPSDKGPFYHGTKADLGIGDYLTPGNESNYKSGLTMNHIYFTALVNGAGLAAALAKGAGRERVYIVEPTGGFEHDPNVTNQKFPGNPTRSYRTGSPLKIVGEVTDWIRTPPEEVQKWRERLADHKGDIIN